MSRDNRSNGAATSAGTEPNARADASAGADTAGTTDAAATPAETATAGSTDTAPTGAAGPDVSTEAPAADRSATGDSTVDGPGPARSAGEPQPEMTPDQGSTRSPAAPGLGAELQALRTELDERVRDLQRVTAEYANYRKRVDRDRALVVEQSTGNVIMALLPILDDLDRAREHGDLVGPFATMADQLTATLTKFGLTGFGAKGDPFDPTRHEAVAHSTSAEVTEPTCVAVMRQGYQLGERLLRPALVAVADPE